MKIISKSILSCVHFVFEFNLVLYFYSTIFKHTGTVSVISRDPLCEDGNGTLETLIWSEMVKMYSFFLSQNIFLYFVWRVRLCLQFFTVLYLHTFTLKGENLKSYI